VTKKPSNSEPASPSTANDEIKATTDGGVGLVERALDRFDEFKASPLGRLIGLALAFLGAITVLHFFKNPLIEIYSSLNFTPENPILWYSLAFSWVAGLATVIILRPRNKITRLVSFLVLIVLATPFVMGRTVSEQHQLVIVYNEDVTQIHPRQLSSVPSYPLGELIKVAQMGEVSSDATFLSTLDRPSFHWSGVFKAGFSAKGPIYSVQEVLNTQDARFIDISFSNFESEMFFYITAHRSEIERLFVYFEPDYSSAEKVLRAKLKNSNSGVPITSIIFDGEEKSLNVSEGMTLVYLGSPENFDNFYSLVSQQDYDTLIIPNWLRPFVDPTTAAMDSNNVVVLSSVFEKLVQKDLSHWIELTSLMDEAITNDENVYRFVGGEVIDDKTIIEVRF